MLKIPMNLIKVNILFRVGTFFVATYNVNSILSISLLKKRIIIRSEQSFKMRDHRQRHMA